jgi:hypothetical protein
MTAKGVQMTAKDEIEEIRQRNEIQRMKVNAVVVEDTSGAGLGDALTLVARAVFMKPVTDIDRLLGYVEFLEEAVGYARMDEPGTKDLEDCAAELRERYFVMM